MPKPAPTTMTPLENFREVQAMYEQKQASEANNANAKPTAPGYYWAQRGGVWELVMVSKSGSVWFHGDYAPEEPENLTWGEFVTGLRD